MLNISTGCEPFFALSYNRKTESLNNADKYYKVEVDAVKEYREVSGNNGELPSYFVSSNDINYKDRINVQSALQEFNDTAINILVA